MFHTTLSHLPEPERALVEAHHILRPGGILAIFDGNYSIVRAGTDPCDPFQACIEAWKRDFVFDCTIVPRLESLVLAAGFQMLDRQNYGYSSDPEPAYLLNVLGRGVDALLRRKTIGKQLAAALLEEAESRCQQGIFYAQLSYASLIAQRKPSFA